MEPIKNTDNSGIILYNAKDSLKDIEDKISCIRGVNVMIDRDLAEIYGVKTKRLNEQVKRNAERFPERYLFQLSDYETLKLVANCDRLQTLKHSTSNPYAFTEQGVSMLASVINSATAIDTSIKIIDDFVAMRHFMQNNAKIFVEIESIKQHQIETDIHLIENDRKIDRVLTLFEKNEQEDKQKLFFDGQIYDAFSLMVSITAIDKFNSQYPNLTLHFSDNFHDRFLIIDNSIAYHIGASIKDAGKMPWVDKGKSYSEAITRRTENP